MALNPFFLQGTSSEQRLTQDLINEHLKIYGVEVTYIPRKYVNTKSIIEEVQSSKFDDNFAIEAYVNTYEGYGGQGDVLTKFGMSIRDEVTLTISKERFEDFIAPFMAGLDDGPGGNEEIVLATRPREGDLVYFPLGERLFEVKFVEHEEPFYQLGKNYVYQLKCELFEYEDEVIDTGIDIIDSQLEDTGYISTLQLIGTGVTATANASINPSGRGYIREIVLNNDGSGYSSTPNVAISTAPFAAGNVNATAVAITTTRSGIFSIDRILLTNAGAGYTTPPIVTITGGGGVGAAATAAVEQSNFGIVDFTITNNGVGYAAKPIVTITGISTSPAAAEVNLLADNTISDILLKNAGIGYTIAPTITIANPSLISGVGNFERGEVVRGMSSGIEARVKEWDIDTKILKISNVGIGSTQKAFIPGETIQATESTHFIVGLTTVATIGVTTTLITGINTSGISLNQELNTLEFGQLSVIGTGATVTNIGAGQINISILSLNTTGVTTVVSFGSSVMTNYSLDFFDEDNQDTTFESNEIIESEADDILDFSEGNPFGTF